MSDAPTAGSRLPAVAGTFYPADPARLRDLVSARLEAAQRHPSPPGVGEPLGLLVPHAGLEYSGLVAAAAWRLLADGRLGETSPGPPTVVFLGTNHVAAMEGVGAWDRGSWRTPLGDSEVDGDLAADIVALGAPVHTDLRAHIGEHSIEVQLPFLQAVAPGARIVPLAIATGVGRTALDIGERLGELLSVRRRGGRRILLVISTDMAHYPSQRVAEWVTGELLGPILDLDPVAVHAIEAAVRARGLPGLDCGMCGIEPAVVGLAALRATGASRGVSLASGTSADAGAPADRTVGYLSVAFG